MNFVEVEKEAPLATVTLRRGKVNALSEVVVAELRAAFEKLEKDAEIRAVIFTGHGKFFSFGFDIPHFLSFSKPEFTKYLERFTALYTYLFEYPKPLVAALNGHTIAGGCMLALACDRRVMAEGKGKISLNEIGFGSSVFAGSVEMLRFHIGSKHATEVLYSGTMYSAAEAERMGLVDEVLGESALVTATRGIASQLGSNSPRAFASIKSLLRRPTAEAMKLRENESIREFVETWYSDSTWANLRKIQIY